MTNLLRAVQCIVKNSISDLKDSKKSINRIHQKGIPLEELIKDIFADSLDESDKGILAHKHSKVFSYLGNQNNPPDLMIGHGDAIEVKKIGSFKTGIQLNSSYPKSKLFANDPMITADCRAAKGEKWDSKDLIYAIGVIKEERLKCLWLIVGDCVAADYHIYQRIKDEIIVKVEKIRDIEFSQNREIAELNQIDYLDSAYAKISGSWGISNPANIYNYLNIDCNEEAGLQVISIMTVEKYHSFPKSDISNILRMAKENNSLKISNVQIKSPNDNNISIDAKLIVYRSSHCN